MIKLGTNYGCHTIPENILTKDSKVYCFGLGEDASFDLELVKIYGCEVNIFDPTLRSIEFYNHFLSENPLIKFFPIGIYNKNANIRFYEPKDPKHVSHSIDNIQNTKTFFIAPVKRLKTILGKNKIDLLKMDIEGAEYAVLYDMIETKIKPKVICVEFHNPEKNNAIIYELIEFGYKVAFENGSQFTFVL